MTSCPGSAPAPLRCPTLPESIDATLKLLPQGRAWQSNEGGPLRFRDAAFDAGAFDPDAFDTKSKPGSILYRFWASVGAVRNYVESRLCALRLEFWCATMSETRDMWLREYSLPDPCDPFPDLCTKVAALGGARCEYYQEVASRAGWSITCQDNRAACSGARAGSARVGSSAAKTGGLPNIDIKMNITVRLADSPAYQAPRVTPPLTGRLRSGQRLVCGPSITPLICVLERVVRAHVPVVYQIV